MRCSNRLTHARRLLQCMSPHQADMLYFALLLPPVAERARAGVGRGVARKLAVELGEQRDAVGEAKLPAGGGQCRVLSRGGAVDPSMLPRELMVESVAAQLDDSELDRMIEMLRERVLAAREEQTLDQITEIKLVEHVPR